MVQNLHCLVSNQEGLGTNSVYYGITSRDPHSKKKHIEVMKNLTFGVDRANIEQDSAFWKLENLRFLDCRTHLPDVYIFLSKFWGF